MVLLSNYIHNRNPKNVNHNTSFSEKPLFITSFICAIKKITCHCPQQSRIVDTFWIHGSSTHVMIRVK